MLMAINIDYEELSPLAKNSERLTRYWSDNLKLQEGIERASNVPDLLLGDLVRRTYGPSVWFTSWHEKTNSDDDLDSATKVLNVLKLPIQVEYNKEMVGDHSDTKMARVWRIATVFDKDWMCEEKIMPPDDSIYIPSISDSFSNGLSFISEWFKYVAEVDEDFQHGVIEPRYGVKTVLQSGLKEYIDPIDLINSHVANYLEVRKKLLDIPKEEREKDTRVQLGLGLLEELVK